MPRTKSAPAGGTSAYAYTHSTACSAGYQRYAESHTAASSRASGKRSTITSTPTLLKAPDESTSSSGVSKPKRKKRKIEVIASGGDMNGEPSTPKPKRTRKKKDPDTSAPEKRGAIFKKKCPQNIIERAERVICQRFFLINRQRNGHELREEFSVLGSTGNVYVVTIDKRPSCTCPDAMKGNHCKHILFIFTKVLQVPQSSHVWYQKALLTSELEEVFRNAPLAPNDMANAQIREAYNKATGRASSSTQPEQARRALSEEDSCAICYESMHDTQESLLTWCQTCGNALHKECFQQWAKRKNTDLDCVYCRSPWALSGMKAKGGKTSEGYLNLAAVAGVSPVRDTSTYYRGPRRGQYYRGYQEDYDDFDDLY